MHSSPVRTACGRFVMCCMQCCMSVSGVLVCGCVVSKKYIDVCNGDVFSVVNVYLDHLKLCVLMVEGMSVVMSPPPAL